MAEDHGEAGGSGGRAERAPSGSDRPDESAATAASEHAARGRMTPEDALAFKANYLDSVPDYDWTDYWGPTNGQISY